MTDKKAASPHATLSLPDGQTIELPTIIGTEKEPAVITTKLRGETGHIAMDPGLRNTGTCTSVMTFIDGEKGILRYRGIPIEQLAEKSEKCKRCGKALRSKRSVERGAGHVCSRYGGDAKSN